MVEISYYKIKGNKVIETVKVIDTLENWGVRGRNATEMTVIDEEKPLHTQRKDICELLKYQKFTK